MTARRPILASASLCDPLHDTAVAASSFAQASRDSCEFGRRNCGATTVSNAELTGTGCEFPLA